MFNKDPKTTACAIIAAIIAVGLIFESARTGESLVVLLQRVSVLLPVVGIGWFASDERRETKP